MASASTTKLATASGVRKFWWSSTLFFSVTWPCVKAPGLASCPEYDAAILDECHTIESVASDYLGIVVTNGQIEYTLNKLYNPHTGQRLVRGARPAELAAKR